MLTLSNSHVSVCSHFLDHLLQLKRLVAYNEKLRLFNYGS